MKMLATTLVWVGISTNAFASNFMFSPASTLIILNGSFSLTEQGNTTTCGASWQFKTNSQGIGKVTGVSFGVTPACAGISGTSLGWRVRAVSASTANILGAGFRTSPGYICGPASTIPITVNGSGMFSFTNVSLPGGCMASGSLQSSPATTIVPN